MDWRAIGEQEESEEHAWARAGRALRTVVTHERWVEADLVERMNLLTLAHDALRPAFGLTRETRLAFVSHIDGHGAGGGYDDETGTYILLVATELHRAEVAPLLAALAHELRHAYQHEVLDGVLADARADLWRQARDHYDPDGPGYEYGPLETDAERAQVAVGAAFSEL